MCFMTKQSQEEINAQFNSINLDYIVEDDDPLAQRREERERPLLDGQNILDWFFDGEDEAGIGDLKKVRLKVEKLLCLVRAVLVVALLQLQVGIVVLLSIMVEVEDRNDYIIMI